MRSILEGMRVISWTVGATGPMAATILGDMGAEVIKVEDPRVGDMARTLNRAQGVNLTMPTGSSLIWEKNNRNARGIALNLKTPKGLEAMYRIVEKADALIQNYRAGAAARLGMDYETLRKINPKLVYASSTGYGHKGPHVNRPNLDTVTLAASGNMTLAGGPDAPPVNNSGMADQMGAVWLAFGAVAALLARERHGFGQEVFSSGLGAMINLQSIAVLSRTATGQGPGYQDRADARNPLANWYRCKGGRWIVLALVQGDRYWPTLCKALDLPELEHDTRFATLLDRERHNKELIDIFDAKFAERTYEEWDGKLFKPPATSSTPASTTSPTWRTTPRSSPTTTSPNGTIPGSARRRSPASPSSSARRRRPSGSPPPSSASTPKKSSKSTATPGTTSRR